MDCRLCNQAIEPERLEALPSTVFCITCAHKHNPIKPKKAFTVHSHKTGSEIQIVSADLYEREKKYYIPNGARSAVKNFSKNVCA